MKVFISYSHKDRYLMEQFKRHLGPLENKFKLSVFSDAEIMPGEEWEKRIWEEFACSEIILVLISIDFLNSQFCLTQEFQKAVVRHRKGQSKIIPIILSECQWRDIPELDQLQVLPDGAHPVRGGKFKSHDSAFHNVAQGINKLLTAATNYRRGKGKLRPPKPSLEDYLTTSYRAIFFDLDGTLLRGGRGHEYFQYSWQLVWAHLGFPESDRKKYYRQYIDKEIGYQQWCDITRDLFREQGLLKSHFYHMAKKVRLTKNCKETLKILRARGIKTVIVSGGIDTFLETVFPDHFDYFDYVFINKFHYDDSGLLKSIETTPYDFEGKYDAILHVCQKHGIKLSECIFVGEGTNDIYAAKKLSYSGGLTIGYPSDRLTNYVAYDLWKDRLDAILDVVFNKVPINQKLPLLFG